MSDDPQLDLFAGQDQDSETSQVPAGECVPKPEQSPAQSQSIQKNYLPPAQLDYIKNLSDYLVNYPERFMTVKLPPKLIRVFLFPAAPQSTWIATHPTENYSIQTGVCEGAMEQSPKVLTIKDFGYFLALLTLVRNTPVQEDFAFNLRHIGYVMAGFPSLEHSLGSRKINLVSGKMAHEFGEALDKAYGRHIHYTESNGKTSAADAEKWLSLLRYDAETLPGLSPRAPASRYYTDVAEGTAFKKLNTDESEWWTVDLKMFFGLRDLVSRAVYMKLLPRLLAGRYDRESRSLVVDGQKLLREIGTRPGAYAKSRDVERNCNRIASDMTGTTGKMGSRLMASVQRDKQSNRVELVIYLEKVVSRKKEEKTLRSRKSFSLWIQSGGSEDDFFERIYRSRQRGIKWCKEEDFEHLRATNLDVRGQEAYYSLVKQLIGPLKFYEALKEYQSHVSSSGENSLQVLSGFFTDKIKSVAMHSQ